MTQIVRGKTDTQAIKSVAKELKVSYQTMHRNWQRRTDLSEMSFEEFFAAFLKELSAANTTTIPERATAVRFFPRKAHPEHSMAAIPNHLVTADVSVAACRRHVPEIEPAANGM